MWQRTKRLINSYLDDLINKVSRPDAEVREVTRAELARLMELEAQTRASVKILEKELAETELKMVGVSERERIARERGDEVMASTAARELVQLSTHCDFLRQQIAEATLAAERARKLREERRREGQDLATETHLTSMRESVAGIESPFGASDPASTLDEMRARLQSHGATTDPRIAQMEKDYEEQRARSKVDDMLAQYKQSISGAPGELQQARPATPAQASHTENKSSTKPIDEEGPEEPKTLGRNEGPLHPID
jgi:phage shock protein A